MFDESNLVLTINETEIPRFIKTGEVSDQQVRSHLEGHSRISRVIATLDITYRMPDHKDLVQNYILQKTDLSPSFPSARKFLEFWVSSLEGPLHMVVIATTLYKPDNVRYAKRIFNVQ